MKFRAYIVLVYGLLLLVGGFMGYQKANSLPSLMMGGGSALLMLASGYAMLKKKVLGTLCALLVSISLSFFFSYRFFLTQNFMPSGLMAILSLIVVMTLLFANRKN
jgi:uncharacterized membrane protein (UPF0136 family)